MRIAVIGAGAWGTALAQSLASAGREVTLWVRDPASAAEIAAKRCNERYLPDVALSGEIAVTSKLAGASSAQILLLAVPAQHARDVAGRLWPLVRPGTPVVVCAKGLEQASGRRLSDVLGGAMPGIGVAVLSGPSFAADVVKGLPTAVTLAARAIGEAEALAEALGHRSLRIYWSDDVTGVELGGALKNVLAIAAGIVVGRGLGASAHAAIVTRGFAEMSRLALACGARAETLAGLSGLGDLILTAGSTTSRNMSLGLRLGRGERLEAILASRRSVSEGVWTAGAAVALARREGVEIPVMAAVDAVLAGRTSIDEAMERLLARPQRAEA
jgi:glycerol-3-phosphate dehydrogenase (NAD(P)+)